MQSIKLLPQRVASNVYAILRVFNLEGKIGLRLYVDLDTSRLDGELDFTIDTWAVNPRGSI
jgi:hypothetical protein